MPATLGALMAENVPIIGAGMPATGSDLLEIKFSLIRIEERMTASADAAEHRHANMKQAMDNFVPRRELDQTFAGITTRLASVDADLEDKATEAETGEIKRRLGKVEDNQTWVIRSILGMVGAAILGAVTYVVKHG